MTLVNSILIYILGVLGTSFAIYYLKPWKKGSASARAAGVNYQSTVVYLLALGAIIYASMPLENQIFTLFYNDLRFETGDLFFVQLITVFMKIIPLSIWLLIHIKGVRNNG
jgi:hypothetical protein